MVRKKKNADVPAGEEVAFLQKSSAKNFPNKLFLWFGALPFTRRLNTDEFVGIMVGSFYCCRCVLPLVVRDRYPADPHEAVTRKSRCLTEDFRSATDMFAQIIFRESRRHYGRRAFAAKL